MRAKINCSQQEEVIIHNHIVLIHHSIEGSPSLIFILLLFFLLLDKLGLFRSQLSFLGFFAFQLRLGRMWQSMLSSTMPLMTRMPRFILEVVSLTVLANKLVDSDFLVLDLL